MGGVLELAAVEADVAPVGGDRLLVETAVHGLYRGP
jgi:hypothetical protein